MLVPVNSKHKTALAAKIQLSDRRFLSIRLNSPWTFLVCILFPRVYIYCSEKNAWVEASLSVYFLSNKTG